VRTCRAGESPSRGYPSPAQACLSSRAAGRTRRWPVLQTQSAYPGLRGTLAPARLRSPPEEECRNRSWRRQGSALTVLSAFPTLLAETPLTPASVASSPTVRQAAGSVISADNRNQELYLLLPRPRRHPALEDVLDCDLPFSSPGLCNRGMPYCVCDLWILDRRTGELGLQRWG
jgi:hypothetical protein